MTNIDNTNLSSSVSVSKYLELEAARDRQAIASFIRERFTERYVTPIAKCPRELKHGFTIMAVSCLMIEALESFRAGMEDTDRRSRQTFSQFFKRCEDPGNRLSVLFSSPATFLNGSFLDDFYVHVRCAILHQAETSNGWRIRREGELFDPETKTINATLFHKAIAEELRRYALELENAPWDSPLWEALKKKMAAVVNNCTASK